MNDIFTNIPASEICTLIAIPLMVAVVTLVERLVWGHSGMTVKMGMWIGILGLGLSLAFGSEQILAVFGLN